MGTARPLSRPTWPARPPSRPTWVACMLAVPAFKQVGVNRLWWRVPLARPSGSAQIVLRGQWGAVDALHVCHPPACALFGPRGCPFVVCPGFCEAGPAEGWALARRRTGGGSGRDAARRLLRLARTRTCSLARFSFTLVRRVRTRPQSLFPPTPTVRMTRVKGAGDTRRRRSQWLRNGRLAAPHSPPSAPWTSTVRATQPLLPPPVLSLCRSL